MKSLILILAITSSVFAQDISSQGYTAFGPLSAPEAFYNRTLPKDYIQIIANENECVQGGQRTPVQIKLDQQVRVGASYAGVTSFGDISLIQKIKDDSILTLFICPRAGIDEGKVQGQLLESPIFTNSITCPIGQISRINMTLESEVPYQLIFRPIDAIGSSLCHDPQGLEINDDREQTKKELRAERRALKEANRKLRKVSAE